MPQAAIVAGINAAGALGAGALASRAQGRASRYQDDAARRAEAFEREQFEYEKQENARREAELRAQWEAQEARRAPYRAAAAAVLQRWGFGGGGEGASESRPMPPGWDGSAPLPSRGPAAPGDPMPLAGSSYGEEEAPPMVPPRRLTLGNLSNWNRVVGL